MVQFIPTDSFVLSLRHFISRSGNIKIIKSYNCTDFVGTATEGKEKLSILDQRRVQNFLITTDIEWIFNPPSPLPLSPWKGGRLQSIIKSIKRILELIYLLFSFCLAFSYFFAFSFDFMKKQGEDNSVSFEAMREMCQKNLYWIWKQNILKLTSRKFRLK